MNYRSKRVVRGLWGAGLVIVAVVVVGVGLWQNQSEASGTTQGVVPSGIPSPANSVMEQGVSPTTQVPYVVSWSVGDSADTALEQYRKQWADTGWDAAPIETTNDERGFTATNADQAATVTAYTTTETGGRTILSVLVRTR